MFRLPPMILTAVIALGGLPHELHARSDHVPERTAPAQANEVVDYWQQAGLTKWFTWNPLFDTQFHDRFLTLHEAAARGDLASWNSTPHGSLALVILLDQFPRHAFRGTPRMYATDHLALDIAKTAVGKGFDKGLTGQMKVFLYQPFGHSDELAMQEKSVALSRNLGSVHQQVAKGHYEIVKRFGRFPHRNLLLQRPMRADEQAYMNGGGEEAWRNSHW